MTTATFNESKVRTEIESRGMHFLNAAPKINSPDLGVVLVKWPGSHHPFVVWSFRLDNSKATFWGHYFVNMIEAQDYFATVAEKE